MIDPDYAASPSAGPGGPRDAPAKAGIPEAERVASRLLHAALQKKAPADDGKRDGRDAHPPPTMWR